MARSIVVRNSGRNSERNGGRNGGRAGGRSGGKNGGRNGGRNGSDTRLQNTTAEVVTNITTPTQDVPVGSNRAATEDVIVGNDGISTEATPTHDAPVGSNRAATEDVIVGNNGISTEAEVVMEPSVGHNAEESQSSSGGVPNEYTNEVRTSMYDHLHARRTVEGRQVIRVFANKLYPSCSRSIRKIFEHRVDLSGYNWENVTAQTKKFYLDELRKRYYWDDAVEELVKIAWNKIAAQRYTEMTCNANKLKKKLKFVPQNIWDEWQQNYFCTPEFLRRSEKNSINRNGGKDGAGPSCHTGGSISHVEHAIRYAKELGRDPTHYELFLKTHTRKKDDQSLVDDKARQVNERMVNLRQQRVEQQEDNAEALDETQIFIEAARGKRRDRVYGIGAVASVHNSTNGGNSAPLPHDVYTAQLEQQVVTLQQGFSTMREELTHLRQQLNERDDERLRELIREMVPNIATSQSGPSAEGRPPNSQPQ